MDTIGISIKICMWLGVLLFTGILFYIQIINGNFYSIEAEKQINILQNIEVPLRGNFYDTNFEKLTENMIVYQVFLDFEKLLSYKDNGDVINLIAELTKTSSSYISSKVQDSLNSRMDIEISTFQEFQLENVSSLYTNLDTLPLKIISNNKSRNYVHPISFSNILGYVGKVDKEDLYKDDFYLFNSTIGKYKLEKDLETHLRGVKSIDSFNTSSPGNSVVLNIDSRWQNYLYNILERYTSQYKGLFGAGVILESYTGKVISLVSYPGFDSNKMSSNDINYYYNVLNDKSSPFIDKSISQSSSPGSTFKLITSHALLENDKVNLNDIYFSNRCIKFANGQDFCEYGKFFYGNMNIIRAIYKSSNLFFCNYTLKTNAINYVIESANQFNLSNLTLIDISGEVSGFVDSPYLRGLRKEGWYDGDTCNTVIGQGGVSVTPLQMALVAATIENGGTYYVPYVVDRIIDHKGNTIKKFQPKVLKNVNISKSRDIILMGMREGVINSEGLIRSLKDFPNNVKAKTGTAESFELIEDKYLPKTHSWIVGTFDFNGTNYAFAFHINNANIMPNSTNVLKTLLNCLNNSFYMGCENI